jgi:transposase
MRPAQNIAEADLVVLERLLKDSMSKSQMQRIQCVLLRARQGMNCDEVATAVGWHPGWVRQVWSRYLNEGIAGLVCQERGGRRRSNLSLEEEQALVEGFAEKARAGGILVVSDIHCAYERAVGHAVPKSTIYRMLARQGWRKVAPRPHHPKNDPAACADFKKNSPASLRKSGRDRRH